MRWILTCVMTFMLCVPALAEVQLTVVDPLTPIYSMDDVEADGDVLRLVGPRGGVCSAQVVATGANLADLAVEVSPLKQGARTLAGDAIEVRFAAVEEGYDIGELPDKGEQRFMKAYYDRLHEDIPADARDLLPIWVTVRVPDHAEPGVYRGQLRAGGQTVPIELTVGAWTCPPPNDWETHVGVVPSHEILAKQYGLNFWSEPHWELIGEQMALLGGIGSDDLWLHLLAHFGYGEGLAQLQFRRVNGDLVPDYEQLDRYIDLFAEKVGEPQWVLINLWDGQVRVRRGKPENKVRVFVDGEKVEVPRPEVAGGEQIWRPVIEHIHQRVTEHHGWDERSILFALAGDQRPAEKTIQTYREWAPYARWAIWTHGRGDKRPYDFDADEPIIYESNGMEIAYYATPYTPAPETWRRRPGKRVERVSIADGIQGGWNQDRHQYTSCRNDLHKYHLPSQYRGFPNGNMLGIHEEETGITDGSAGFAFLWFDFWPQGSYQPFVSRWCHVLTRKNTPSIVEPGPDGPVATVRYEQFREGLQETEARLLIERALVEGDLPDDLADKARAHLDEMMRLRFNLDSEEPFDGGHAGSDLGRPTHMWSFADYPEWMEQTATLFDLAAQVERATAGRR